MVDFDHHAGGPGRRSGQSHGFYQFRPPGGMAGIDYDGQGTEMLHLTSWMTTLPIMVIGMLGIVLVIGVIVLAVMLLNRLTGRK